MQTTEKFNVIDKPNSAKFHAPPLRNPQPELLQPNPLENKMNTTSNQNRPAIFIPSIMDATLVCQVAAALKEDSIVYWAGAPQSLGFNGYRSQPLLKAGDQQYMLAIDATYIQSPNIQANDPISWANPYQSPHVEVNEPSQEEIAAYFVELFDKLKALIEVVPDVVITLVVAQRHNVMTPQFTDGPQKRDE